MGGGICFEGLIFRSLQYINILYEIMGWHNLLLGISLG